MNPDDDPEARIRQLEQPLSDTARASELGETQAPDYGYQPPSPPPPPPTYGSYGAGGLYPPPTKSSGNRVFWIVGAMFIVGMLILVGGIAMFAMNRFPHGSVVVHSPPQSTAREGNSPRTKPNIVVPSFTNPATTGTEPTEPSASPPETSASPPAGSSLTVSGIGDNRTIACNDNIVSVSGVSNTVVITGHCTRLTVSGVKNAVTVDSVDSIEASGLENQVTYHSGSPKISKSGQSNVVQQS